jgi:glycosyltransferase involved in cell wall biosynthesis
MACGTPVVASAAGALPEVIETGGGGMLVPPEDPEALAERLAILERRPALARRMGEAGYARARRAYTWRRVVRSLSACYARLVAAERRGPPLGRRAPGPYALDARG